MLVDRKDQPALGKREASAMAKTTIPGLKTGGGLLRKLIGTAVVVTVLVLVVKHPDDSAEFVKATARWGGGVIDGIVTFFQHLD